MHSQRKPILLPNDPPSLDCSSLIDVCFLLLIYFLVTTTIQPRELDLEMRLPGVCMKSERIPIAPLSISIKADQSIIINESDAPEKLDSDATQRSLPLLEERLRVFTSAIKDHTGRPSIYIHANEQAPQQRVVDVLNLLAKLSIDTIIFKDLEESTPMKL